MPAPCLRMTTNTDTERTGTAGLYRLLAWSSPAFPIGAFSYSHGLEAAAADGVVRDRVSLQAWVAAIVLRGSGRVDADILRDAYRATQCGDTDALIEANRRGVAYRATSELALESGQQGGAFVAAWQSAWQPAPHPNPLPACGERERVGDVASPRLARGEGEGSAPKAWEGEELLTEEGVSHAAAFGAAAASAGIALEDALLAYLQTFASNLVSAGIRLGIVGQTDGQRILAALEPGITAAAAAAIARSPEEFGGATFAADIASMAHETQYTRLFRS